VHPVTLGVDGDDLNYAHLIAPVVTTLSFNKIRVDIPVPANRGPHEK